MAFPRIRLVQLQRQEKCIQLQIIIIIHVSQCKNCKSNNLNNLNNLNGPPVQVFAQHAHQTHSCRQEWGAESVIMIFVKKPGNRVRQKGNNVVISQFASVTLPASPRKIFSCFVAIYASSLQIMHQIPEALARPRIFTLMPMHGPWASELS